MEISSKILLVLFLLISSSVFAQNNVKGTVSDDLGSPLSGIDVLEKGTTNGTITGYYGNYSINVADGATLIFSYVGYSEKQIAVGTLSSINVTLSQGVDLDQVILVGSRTIPRSRLDTPLPVDVISSGAILSTGQITFDKALQYRIPSFNTVQLPVSDATSLTDPYEIRNMGPSRTLILINGKRKNLSSLLNSYTSPGIGETGVDISAIPMDAIKRVEVLRDGASAQYGSDAIAGVINIILKDDTSGSHLTLRTGITARGDGESFGMSLNNGTAAFRDKGFINYTIDLSKVALANRPGKVNAQGEAKDFGADIEVVEQYLSRRPDAGNINGSPENATAKFLINGALDLSDHTTGYFNMAYVYKKANSFANYRTPYWRTIEQYPYLSDFFPAPGTPNNYDGYLPTFEGELNDYNATMGFKGQINGWNTDASITLGGNLQTYKVNNSHNGNYIYSPSTWIDLNGNGSVDDGEITEGSLLYRENSPLSFDPGGASFSHTVGNIDLSRRLSSKLSTGFGVEFRSEVFNIIEGVLSSYDGGGSDSFEGNRAENSGKFNRYNIGGYLSMDYDITDAFLVSGTIRAENYSDFGSAFVYKLSSRLKLGNNLNIRLSSSSGFRAPTLHQIYTQRSQYGFVAGQGIQVGGLVNNISPQARLLNLSRLDPERSRNFTIGVGGRLKKFSFTVDYYNIALKDRIVMSTKITGTEYDENGVNVGTTTLDDVLRDNNLSDVSFFVNALNTRTSGIDVVTTYKKIPLTKGQLEFSLSGNYTIVNQRVGAVNNPQLVADAGQSVVNQTQEALFFTSRPKTKWILGGEYKIDNIGFSIYNTLFGKSTFFQNGLATEVDPLSGETIFSLRTEFLPKVVTDLAVNYKLSDKLTITFNINNLLDVLPVWEFKAETETGESIIDGTSTETTLQEQSNLITFNQRYSQMTYGASHFSQLGTLYNLSLNYKL